MARKRASPTAAPTMLGVLRFMVFSWFPSALVDERRYCTSPAKTGALEFRGLGGVVVGDPRRDAGGPTSGTGALSTHRPM